MSLLDDDACTAFDELLCCWQIPLRVIASVFQQLIVGLRHLHACGVLHRDLKSDNAMVAARDPLVLKWGDFGVSVLLSVVTEYGQGASPLSGVLLHYLVAVLFSIFLFYTKLHF